MAFNVPDTHKARDPDHHIAAAHAAERRSDWWDAVANWGEAIDSLSKADGTLADGRKRWLQAMRDRAVSVSRGAPVTTPPTLQVHEDPPAAA